MGSMRKLSPEAVHELLARVEEGASRKDVAQHFGISVPLITAIINGHAYTDITGRTPFRTQIHYPGTKNRDLLGRDQRALNIDAARAFRGVVPCDVCREPVERTAASVLDAKGLVLCDTHDRRRR